MPRLFDFERIKKGNVPPDWHDRVIVLWEEDDALRSDPTAEHIAQAWERHVGHPYNERSRHERGPLAEWDGGDSGETVYEGGWVIGWTPDGSYLGRVVTTAAAKVDPESPIEVARAGIEMDEDHRIGAIDCGVRLYAHQGVVWQGERQVRVNEAFFSLCSFLEVDPARAAGVLSALELTDWHGGALYRAVPAAYLLAKEPGADPHAVVGRLVLMEELHRDMGADEHMAMTRDVWGTK